MACKTSLLRLAGERAELKLGLGCLDAGKRHYSQACAAYIVRAWSVVLPHGLWHGSAAICELRYARSSESEGELILAREEHRVNLHKTQS